MMKGGESIEYIFETEPDTENFLRFEIPKDFRDVKISYVYGKEASPIDIHNGIGLIEKYTGFESGERGTVHRYYSPANIRDSQEPQSLIEEVEKVEEILIGLKNEEELDSIEERLERNSILDYFKSFFSLEESF